MRQPSKGQDCIQPLHCRDFRDQKRTAAIHLGGDRLVLRRQTTDCIRNPHVVQPDVIISILVISAACKPMPAQHVEQIAACRIACERSSGAVRPLATGRKADDQQP